MATHQSEDNMIGLSKVTRPLSFKDDEMKLMRSFSFNKGDPDSLPTPKRSPKKVVLEYSPSFKNWEPQKKLEQSFSFNNSQGLDASQTAKVDNKLEISPRPKSEPKKCDATARAEGYSPSFRNWKPEKKLEPSLSFRTQGLDSSQVGCSPTANVDNEVGIIPEVPLYQLLSPKPKNELDQCATKLQKVYRSYRTRRNLADAAVIAEQIWWQQAREKASQNPESVSEKWWHALDYASLNINSFSFYHKGESEKAVSRWSRAKKRLAKVGKGLSKDQKAQKLALQHWLEAIDPRHRYGHNLHLYYDVWFISESTQPFFYWLDAGDGKVIEHAKCPRSRLQSQIITYLGPTERESYEVVVVNGRLIHKKKQNPVNTTEGSKWIFVLSTSRTLYVGQKKKGTFQHSSFLAGAATTSAGRMVAKDGYLQAIWPYSGHYLPTEENFKEFISFLVDNSVDLSGVKRCSVDDDEYSLQKPDSTEISNDIEVNTSSTSGTDIVEAVRVLTPKRISGSSSNASDTAEAGRVTPRWCTAAGARINCVSSYPVDLQQKALQHVNLSPRILPSSISQNKLPIPSPGSNPRPSPHLTRLGFQPSPRGFAADLQVRDVANGSPKIILSPLRNRTSATSPRRSPMGKVLSTPSPAGFPCPKVTLRLPSLKARRFR